MRVVSYLFLICALLSGCPGEAPVPADLGKTSAAKPKTQATPAKTDAAKSDPGAPSAKRYSVRSRETWLTNAVSYASFPRPQGQTTILSFFCPPKGSAGDEVQVKLLARDGALAVEIGGARLDVPGRLTAASAKGHPVWKRLEERLAARRRRYSGRSPHGPPVEVLIASKTPVDVTREALRVVANSFPDEAYAEPKRAPLVYGALIPKRGYDRVRKPRTPRIGAPPLREKPIIVPKIGPRSTDPRYLVHTRSEWLAQATRFAREAQGRKVALLFFCASAKRARNTPTLDLNELRVKLLAGAGKPVVRCGRKDLNRAGEVSAENSAGHAVWQRFQKQVDHHKLYYKGSSEHGLPVRIDVDPGVPIEVTQEALKIVAAIYHDQAFAKPKLPPLQRAYLQGKKR